MSDPAPLGVNLGRLFARADVRWREVAGEVAIMLNGNVELLPVKARALWRFLEVPRSFDDLVAFIASANGASPSAFVSDVADQLERLVDLQLVDAVA